MKPTRLNEIGYQVEKVMWNEYDPTEEEKDLIAKTTVKMKKLIAQELYK